MSSIRLAIICDFVEEGWQSMDLVAEMLAKGLTHHSSRIDAKLICPRMLAMMKRVPLLRQTRLARNTDRVINRHWLYPEKMKGLEESFDLFHVVDHSYAHLIHALPPDRVVVTCHDLDAFRTVLFKCKKRTSLGTFCYKWFSRQILSGLGKAACVVFDSEAVRNDAARYKIGESPRTFVVPLGAHLSCSPRPNPKADSEALKLLGATTNYLLHVGSTIPRKRIDVLLEVFAAVRHFSPEIRLVQVGGALTSEQTQLAKNLGLPNESIVVLPHISREVLASVYRGAAFLLQPSDEEGFCLPVIEAMACGTPVLASDIAVLKEVGGSATAYCLPGDVKAWVKATRILINERKSENEVWSSRRRQCLEAAKRFTWTGYVERMSTIYEEIYLRSDRCM